MFYLLLEEEVFYYKEKRDSRVNNFWVETFLFKYTELHVQPVEVYSV